MAYLHTGSREPSKTLWFWPVAYFQAKAESGCGTPSHRKQGTIKTTMVLISPDLGKRAGANLHAYIPMAILKKVRILPFKFPIGM